MDHTYLNQCWHALIFLILSGFLAIRSDAQNQNQAPQPTDADRRQALLIDFMKKTAADISANALTNISRLEEWKRQRPAIKQQVMEMLGLNPLPARTPLNVQITGTSEQADFRVENIVFQSQPGLYVTGNLYLPKIITGRLPAILYVCGHSPHPKGAKYNYQDHAIWFVQHGYLCLIIDTLEFGEVAGIHHGLHNLNRWYWLSLGYTPAGVEVWNAMRAIDYLQTRPEIAPERIAITGRSGGGAVSWYAAAADERIAVAVPVCGTFTFGSQAAHWIASGQCDCIYFHNTYQLDLPTVGALIAPRPLLIISGQQDRIFPPDGYHAAFQKIKNVYDLYQTDKDTLTRIREVDENVEHRSTPLMRREARLWMNRWLKGITQPLASEPIPTEKLMQADELACLTQLPADAINYRIQDAFIPVAKLKSYSTRTAWEKRSQAIKRELSEKTFRWFPKADIPFTSRVSQNNGGWLDRYAEYQDVEIETEPGVRIRFQLLRARNAARDLPTLVYLKRAEDSIYAHDVDELLPLLGRYHVVILNTRLTDQSVSAADFTDIERTAAWCGRTIAAMQVWDVLRTIQWLGEETALDSSSFVVYGKSEMGIIALYAAVFDGRIRQIILSDPPDSHWQGPALLNVLRLTDIPEVAAMFAPRKLVFLRRMPEGYAYTRDIYELYQQSEQLITAGSLPEALEIWKY